MSGQRKWPKKISVGSVDYEVSFVDNPGGKDTWGFINQKDGLMEISRDIGYQIIRITLWHEILHAVLDDSGETELSKDEKVVTIISSGIVQVMKDNPELVLKMLEH